MVTDEELQTTSREVASEEERLSQLKLEQARQQQAKAEEDLAKARKEISDLEN